MKTPKELNDIGQRIYWSIEHGRAGEVISELQAVQDDALRTAAKIAQHAGTYASDHSETFLPWNHPLRLEAEELVRRYHNYAQTHLPGDSAKELASMIVAFLQTHLPPNDQAHLPPGSGGGAPCSANPPEKITTLSELISARERRKAITCPSSPCFRGPIPAAFMANLSGEVLHRLMAYGMWVYTQNDKLRDAAT